MKRKNTYEMMYKLKLNEITSISPNELTSHKFGPPEVDEFSFNFDVIEVSISMSSIEIKVMKRFKLRYTMVQKH